jgi:hypothetical protein
MNCLSDKIANNSRIGVMKKIILYILVFALALSLAKTDLFANPLIPSWRIVNDGGPARYQHKCAFDIGRNTIVLFGGKDSSTQMPGEVWEFTFTGGWSENVEPGPEGRTGHGLCYDSASHVTILFGGQNQAGEFLNDTWSWNGAQWTRLDSTGPGPRANFSMAYDNGRQRVVLFGGANTDSLFGDTWEWDGIHWQNRNVVGPSPRIFSSIAYDNAFTRMIILFGGETGLDGPALNDTWIWDGQAWNQIQTSTSPSIRVGHSMAAGGAWYMGMFVFGGANPSNPDSVFGDSWELNTWSPNQNWHNAWWMEINPPGRKFADMVSNGYINYLIGGTNGSEIFHDIWKYPIYYITYVPGDVNNSGRFNSVDIVFSVNFFRGGQLPAYAELCNGHTWFIMGDVNGSCDFNGLDVTCMVAYFMGRGQITPCPDCPPNN